MRLRGYSLIIALLIGSHALQAHFILSGTIVDAATGKPLAGAEVYNRTSNFLTSTNSQGRFEMRNLEVGEYTIIVVSPEYETRKKAIQLMKDTSVVISMKKFERELSEVVISRKREEIFALNRLRPVEDMGVYAGKKTEVVLLDQLVGNLAANNSRQIYSQIVGLNIYEGNDAGLQLNIGGRGLDPNRTANFNTRQNGYDISADVLGYPESYYTPPAEALSEIQIVRGAASLQYGTQFGGLINFKMKAPSTEPVEWVTRQSIASFGLVNSFNSLSGKAGRFSYYTFFNHKRGKGFRPNATFNANNLFGSFGYEIDERTKLTVEVTGLNYLSQQPGGLTDAMFHKDPDSSVRTRNWFKVSWRLYSLKLTHKCSPMTEWGISLFGLNAQRNTVGFRGIPGSLNTNPVTDEDIKDEDGVFLYPRDVIKATFQNCGLESRLLTRYRLRGKDAAFLLGAKIYLADNTNAQGAGSTRSDPDFQLVDHFGYPNRSEFQYPNKNFAIFGENVFFLSRRFSVTPGFRLENIRTESKGYYHRVNFDISGTPIDTQVFEDNRKLDRSFLLLGVGVSYEPEEDLEIYANVSENYRSITFNDIRVVNPSFIVDPNISDEWGYTFDMGLRGKWNAFISYDISGFGLLYNDRIGVIFDDRANRVRKNIGKAVIYGLETFLDINMIKGLKITSIRHKLNWYVNAALTDSRYMKSEENNVVGRQVEFIPGVNLKTGLRFGYQNLLGSFQYTYVSDQYTDVENSGIAAEGSVRNGLIGIIPSYSVADLSLSYKIKKVRIESGINNVFNNRYFTRRATGYPGPGIIPSEPMNFYLTLQFSY